MAARHRLVEREAGVVGPRKPRVFLQREGPFGWFDITSFDPKTFESVAQAVIDFRIQKLKTCIDASVTAPGSAGGAS